MENKLKIKSEIKRLKEKGYPIGTFEGSAGYYDALDEVLNFIDSLPEEPVSEDLIEELKKIVNIRECVSQGVPVIKIARHFAEWQKEQFEKNRLKHCNSITNEQAELEQGFIDQHLDKHQRIPTYLDAIEYGMNLQKEQMIKNAVDGVVAASAGALIATGFVKSEDVNVKFGDKIKIIIIKNDEL